MNNNSIKENKKKCDNKSKVSIDAITVIEQSGSELIIPQSSRSSSLDSLQIVVPQSEQRTKNILKTKTNIPSMKQICVSIFLYYSTFSFEEKDFVLSQNNLTKLLKEMKIISNNGLKSYEVDLLFTKMKNKCKKMISKDFLNLLVQISEKIFHQDFVKSPQIALQKLNDKYTQPYYEYLTNPKSIINPNSIFSFHQNIEKKIKILSFDPNILFIFNDIYPSLKTIYCLYFLTETNGQGNLDIIIKDSLEHLISFSKEFEITPYFVEINKIVIIYHIVLELTPYEITKYLYNDGNIFDENKNMGKIFTLSKFAIFLLHISILHFEKLNKSLDKKQFESVSMGEKLLLFLDKLNHGKGLSHLRNKFSFNANNQICLIPSKETLNSVNKILIEKNKNVVSPPKNEIIKILNNDHNEYISYIDSLTIKADSILQRYLIA